MQLLQLSTFALAAFAAPALSAQTVLYTFQGTSGDQLGHSVAAAGDVDNDGVRDLIVGAPLDDPNGASSGRATVYSGKTGLALHVFNGNAAGDELGYAVAGVGDIDDDHYDDVAVGAPGNDIDSLDAGMVRVYSGRTGGTLRTWLGWEAGDRFGHAVAAAGDVDDDGRSDVVIGAPFADRLVPSLSVNVGAVRVYSGATGSTLWVKTFDTPNSLFGWSVAGVGDVDNDGHDDVIAGAAEFDAAGLVDRGAASLLSGANGFTLFWLQGAAAGDKFGWSVAGVGLCDGDSRPDFAVGAPLNDANGTSAGAVTIYSGASGAVLHQKHGVSGAKFGTAVAGVGDVDNDGRGDFFVGSPDYDYLTWDDTGLAHVYSGKLGNAILPFTGGVGDKLGGAVAGVGDLNFDGTPDLVMGAPHADGSGSNSGYARVLLLDAPVPFEYCTAKTNSLGCVPAIASSGVPSKHVANNFHVTASHVRSQKAGMLFWSLSSSTFPFHGGTLCVGVPFLRTPAQNSGGSAGGSDCSGAYDFFFSQSYMTAIGLQGGHTVKAQYWSRDPGFAYPDNVGLTDALSFEVLN